MLRIRTHQLAAMQEARLAGTIYQHLYCHHHASFAPLTSDERARLVTDGITRARSYGMSAPASMGAVSALILELGPDFDRNPALSHALTDPCVAPDERLARLVDRVAAVVEPSRGNPLPPIG